MKNNVKTAKANSTWLRPSFRYFGFSEMLKWYMHEKHITSKELSTRCGISEYLVRKAMKSDDDTEWMPLLLPVVLGIGLEMSASDIHALLSTTGHQIPNTCDPWDLIVRYIIDMSYPKTVAECNRIMEDAGFEKLTDFNIYVPSSLNKYIPRKRKK